MRQGLMLRCLQHDTSILPESVSEGNAHKLVKSTALQLATNQPEHEQSTPAQRQGARPFGGNLLAVWYAWACICVHVHASVYV